MVRNLLIHADADRFYENLVRSGHTRRYFLQKSAQEGNTSDYQLAISRWDSFLDAVVAGHFSLARGHRRAVDRRLGAHREYEDDFCCRYFLHRFIMPLEADRDVRLQAGASRQPLWITAIGMDVEEAARHVVSMHGPYRIPTLLTWVDRLAAGDPPAWPG